MIKKSLALLLIAACLLIAATQVVSASKYLKTQIESDTVHFVVVDRDTIAHTIEVALKDAAKITTKVKGDKKVFKGIATDVNSEYLVEDGRIKEEIILLTDKAKPSFEFEIVKATRLTVEQYGTTLRFLSAEGGYPVVTCPEPYATDALGEVYRYEYKLVGDKIKLQPVDSLKDVVYPLTIDPSYYVSTDGIASSTYGDRNLVRASNDDYYMCYVVNTGGNDTVRVAKDTGTGWNVIKSFTELYGYGSYPSLAIDSNNNLHLVWTQEYNSTRSDIYYSYFNGSEWSTPERITHDWYDVLFNNFSAYYAAIAMDSENKAHIGIYWTATWDEYTLYISGVGYVRGYEGTSEYRNTVTTIPYSAADIELGTTTICVDDADKIHLAFTLRDTGEVNNQIFYSSSVNYGISWSEAEPLTKMYDGSQTQPSIGVDNENNPSIAYGAYSSGNWTSRRIFVVYYNGTEWSAPINITTLPLLGGGSLDGYWQGKPSISPNTQYDSGYPSHIFVVWYGYDSLYTTDTVLHYFYRYEDWEDSIHIYREVILNLTYPCALYGNFPERCNIKTNTLYHGYIVSYTFENDTVYTTSLAGYSFEELGGFSLTVTAKNIETGESIMNFTANLDTGSSDSTTDGSIRFDCEDADTWIAVSVQSTGYYLATENVYLDSDKTVSVRMTAIQEDVYVEPRIHLVEWRVQTRYAQPIPGIMVSATPVNTSGFWNWLRSLFLLDEEAAEEIQNSTLNATTDSNGIVVFTMLETIEYEIRLYNATLGIDETYYFFPKQDSYVITVGEIPSQKIAYYITTEQNNTANLGNITCHFLDYASPVETEWVNFSVFYADNDTLIYSHNFTSPSNLNEDTSDDLNASYTYKVVLTASHSELGVITTYTIIVFVVPEHEKIPFGDLSDTQLTIFSCFILIFMGMIFGAVASGTGGIILIFTALGLYVFGWLPLIGKATAAIIFPLFILLAVVNKLSERPRGYPA